MSTPKRSLSGPLGDPPNKLDVEDGTEVRQPSGNAQHNAQTVMRSPAHISGACARSSARADNSAVISTCPRK
jgi:hypothetical protein